MAKMSIDLFPFFKQRKAVISPVYPYGDVLAIAAEHGYGSWWETAKTHAYFQREIKEDI